ncbi:MAG: carbon-nitrogen hydrolase family protein, partial [Actinoallomurus sp.]
MVQAASVFLDRDASVRKAVTLIEQAGDLGADVVVFPEGFIPTHPVWFHFHAATSGPGRAMARELFRNSVVVGGGETDLLAAASRRAGVWSVIGMCEKRADTTGTMWNTAVHFSPQGEIVGVHRKTTPTSGERLVHMPGDGRGLRIPRAPFGPISTMICAENFNPLLIFNANAQYPVVHAALWPSHFNTTSQPMRETILTASKAIAFQNGSYVLNAAGVPDPASIERIALQDSDLEWLANRQNLGGSSIVAPNGQVLAGPASAEEVILTAELDLDELIGKRLVHDYAGHYNRADLF